MRTEPRFVHFNIVSFFKTLNYNDSIGNAKMIKKTRRGNVFFAMTSKACLKAASRSNGIEIFKWTEAPLEEDSSSAVLYADDALIDRYVELDLYGYLNPRKKGASRPAVVSVTDAISLEPYYPETYFHTNGYLASRIGAYPNIYNKDRHEGLFAYCVTIDLHRLGIDKDTEIPVEEKIQRVKQVLWIFKTLYRKAEGEIQSLAPIFVAGGIYEIGNPFFLNTIALGKPAQNPLKYTLDAERFKETWDTSYRFDRITDDGKRESIEKKVSINSKIGVRKSFFENLADLGVEEDKIMDIDSFFRWLESEVENYYKGEKKDEAGSKNQDVPADRKL